MEKLYILHKQALDSSDPHGYFRVNDHELVTDPTKRFFLSECIHQIYIMNGINIPIMSMLPEYNKTVIWHNMNILMGTSSLTSREILLQRIKRRLFPECKKTQRKCQKPQLNHCKLSEGIYFKASRYILGIRKVRRNYLAEAKENVRNDLHKKCKITEAAVDDIQWNNSQIHVNNSGGGLLEVYQQAINETYQYQIHHSQQGYSFEEDGRVSRRSKKFEELLSEYHYRMLSIANDNHVEGAVRGLLYIKALIALMVNKEYDCNLYS